MSVQGAPSTNDRARSQIEELENISIADDTFDDSDRYHVVDSA
jgi:hypothetical protein